MAPNPTTFEQPRISLAKLAPAINRAMVALDGALELDSSLRDLVSLRASILNGCAYCIDMHTLDAKARGETEQRLHAIAAWHEAPFFTERERAALQLTDAITLIADSHVPRDAFDAARTHFEERELAQLIWAVVVINAWNRVAVTSRALPGEYEPG
ncbi:MAG: carboxymuconolactone decarboxylase family protein [Candidatus Dormiibacterota bacterium]|jgi:AhpD family alkylhydroperoxidase